MAGTSVVDAAAMLQVELTALKAASLVQSRVLGFNERGDEGMDRKLTPESVMDPLSPEQAHSRRLVPRRLADSLEVDAVLAARHDRAVMDAMYASLEAQAAPAAEARSSSLVQQRVMRAREHNQRSEESLLEQIYAGLEADANSRQRGRVLRLHPGELQWLYASQSNASIVDPSSSGQLTCQILHPRQGLTRITEEADDLLGERPEQSDHRWRRRGRLECRRWRLGSWASRLRATAARSSSMQLSC